MQHVDTVRKIYRDFAAGDAAAILATFADDVEFRLAEGHPYRGSGGAWTGKEAIATQLLRGGRARVGGLDDRRREDDRGRRGRRRRRPLHRSIQTYPAAHGRAGVPRLAFSRRQGRELSPVPRHGPTPGCDGAAQRGGVTGAQPRCATVPACRRRAWRAARAESVGRRSSSTRRGRLSTLADRRARQSSPRAACGSSACPACS